MRKIVFSLVLILSIFCCYTVSIDGINTKLLKVANYEQVSVANKQLDTKISDLNRKNTTEFESKRTALTTAVINYKAKKEQYEAPTVKEEEPEEENNNNSPKAYDIDFLWTIVGNYATTEGISLNFTFVKSSTASASSSDYYTMSDINFTVSGTYNSVIEFVYDIEDDDRLGFEIKNFKMSKGGTGVQATFSAIGVPINSETITSLTTDTTSSGVNTDTNTVGNTTVDGANNTVSDTNTANMANTAVSTNTIANTTNTEVSTNTITNTTNTAR